MVHSLQNLDTQILLNQARAWFLKIVSVWTSVCVFVYVCVRVSALEAINN